jgi:Holliday junction resolvase
MGKMQRDKGARVEREIVKILNGKRVPLSGATSYAKGDVEAHGMTFEVKARKDGFKQIYGWLEGEDVDALVIKADRKEPLVVQPIQTFKKQMEALEDIYRLCEMHDRGDVLADDVMKIVEDYVKGLK